MLSTMLKTYNNMDTVIMTMFEKFIYNIINTTGLVVIQFAVSSLAFKRMAA